MRRTTLTILLTLFVLPFAATADETGLGQPTTLEEAQSGTLLFETEVPGLYLPAPALQTDVSIHVTALVARTAVEQRFTNPTDSWVEGVYVFPLPESAAVDTLRMTIGERVVRGEIREREEAKKVYEQAKREGRKASLVEQERPNIFTTSVANIGPGETVVVAIEYQEEVRYDSGRFSLRFPMVVAPRYIPGTPTFASSSYERGEETWDAAPPESGPSFSGLGWAFDTYQVPDASRVTPPVAPERSEEGLLNPVRLEVVLETGLPLDRLESLSHEVEVVSDGPGRYAVGLSAGQVEADRDFVLEWEPRTGSAPKAALFSQDFEGERYVLLMVLPPHGAAAAGARLARETIFVIDTSGSMNGASIRQAREALVLALGRLRPGDRFNIIRFANAPQKLFPSSVDAEPWRVEAATQWVLNLTANGGTEILGALQAALGEPGGETRLQQVIFMTDGSVGNEDAVLAYLEQNLGDRRLFTVGIGSAPNSYFMKKAAQLGRGTFTYVADVRQVGPKMGELFAKIESPVLTGVELTFDDPLAEVWPAEIGDLYSGEPVQVAARLPSGGTSARITGWRGSEPWETSFAVDGGSGATGIDKLWARRKIEALMDGGRSGADAETVKSQVVEVALHHHLVSRYTSLVAVDPIVTAPEGTVPETRPLPIHLPAGWTGKWPAQAAKASVRLPATATPAALKMLLGSFLLLFAAQLLRLSRRSS